MYKINRDIRSIYTYSHYHSLGIEYVFKFTNK